MPVVAVDDLVARVRQRADIETSTGSADYITDTEIVQYIDDGYRALLDLIIDNDGLDPLTTSATVTGPGYALPADFYRSRGVDVAAGNGWVALRGFNWAERNYGNYGVFYPAWRCVGSVIQWAPVTVTPPSTVKLWYIATPAALASGDSFAGYNGWDDYIVSFAAIRCVNKEERDVTVLAGEMQMAAARIAQACASLKLSDPETIADTAVYPVDIENIW